MEIPDVLGPPTAVGRPMAVGIPELEALAPEGMARAVGILAIDEP